MNRQLELSSLAFSENDVVVGVDYSRYSSSSSLTLFFDFGKGEGNMGRLASCIQDFGCVFEGLLTSELYVYPSMPLQSPTEDDYLGIYSIMFWILTLIGVVKYANIAIKANDQGEALVEALSAVVLVILFLLQKFGTSRVSFLFSPIMGAWTLSTPLVGIYSIIRYYPCIIKALSPHNIFRFFWRKGKSGLAFAWWYCPLHYRCRSYP